MAGEHDFTPLSEARQGVLRLRGVMVTVVAIDSLWFELRLCAVRLQRRMKAAILALVAHVGQESGR